MISQKCQMILDWDSNQSGTVVSPHLDDSAILKSNKQRTP